jgi:hypothetical protein
MRRAFPLLLVLAVVAGCGDSEPTSSTTSTPAPAATTSTPTPTTSADSGNAADNRYVVVTSLLGRPLPKEPGCTFAKNFVPTRPPPAYDGGLALTVTCKAADGYTPIGQIVNREGSKPSEITCRDTNAGQLYCLYVPNSSVGLYFTGTDRAVVRRRLEHLMEVVRPLPAGISPIAGAGTP